MPVDDAPAAADPPRMTMPLTAAAAPASPPALARALGYAGLLPFVGGAAWLVVLQDPAWRASAGLALASYAALIVSFLGGIHWGLAFAADRPAPSLFAWGVLPSLGGWGALLLPRPSGLACLAGLLLVCMVVDRGVYAGRGLAHWLPLRLQLSTVAALSCAVGAAFA